MKCLDILLVGILSCLHPSFAQNVTDCMDISIGLETTPITPDTCEYRAGMSALHVCTCSYLTTW